MKNEIEKRISKLRAASTFEDHAYEVHLAIWNQRNELFAGTAPIHPLDLLEPAVALHLKGFDVRTDPHLGEMWEDGRHIRTAGIVDQESRVVRVSPAITDQERRFTTAHELGHVVLHPHMTGLHRDRTLSGPSQRKDKLEREADAFAACFLMPAKMIFMRFRERFGADVFRLNEDAAFGLRLGSIDQARRHLRYQRDVSLALATTNSFMGVSFDSLSALFRVSTVAMAIRLEEVGLVDSRSTLSAH